MSSYDLDRLNDKEFEALAVDVLSVIDNVRFERFKPGRDSGVDGRFFSPCGGEVVLQVKHWRKTPLAKLVKHLENSELPKIVKLNCKRYILFLSHNLSRHDKKQIADLLSPFVLSEADIYGAEDIEDFLSKNSNVERRHYKLWLSSAAVLSHVFNKDVYGRSAFVLEEAVENSEKYALTENHEKARTILAKNGALIITGVAGIGKTTLALQLALELVLDGYDLISIADDIEEAERTYDQEQKQVFYFDDFLGKNYLEALKGNEGSRVTQFIRRVMRNASSKKFILTSRTTILNQGKTYLDSLQDRKIERTELEISIQALPEIDKAKILYNHLWCSGLNEEYVDALYENKRYKDVIRHKNFNPRLISFLTDIDHLVGVAATEYWSYIVELLANPAEIWERPFETQIDDYGRVLVLIIATNGRSISEQDLSNAYNIFLSRHGPQSVGGTRDFITALRHLTGTFVNRTMFTEHSAPLYTLINPSLGDYVLSRYAMDAHSLETAFISIKTVDAINNLISMTRNRIVNDQRFELILEKKLEDAFVDKFIGYDAAYLAKILHERIKLNGWTIERDEKNLAAIRFLLDTDIPTVIEDIAGVMDAAVMSDLITIEDADNFILAALEGSPDAEEIRLLSYLIENSSNSQDQRDLLRSKAVEYIVGGLSEEFDEQEVFSNLAPTDFDEADERIEQMVRARLADIGVEAVNADVSHILDQYGTYDRMQSYFSDYDGESYRSGSGFVDTPYVDQIDDLFERS